MRISVLKGDPGYSDLCVGGGARVFLAGVEVSHVVTADEELRYAKQCKLDDKGHPMLNAAKDDVEYVDFWGDVRIEMPEHIRQAIVAQQRQDKNAPPVSTPPAPAPAKKVDEPQHRDAPKPANKGLLAGLGFSKGGLASEPFFRPEWLEQRCRPEPPLLLSPKQAEHFGHMYLDEAVPRRDRTVVTIRLEFDPAMIDALSRRIQMEIIDSIRNGGLWASVLKR